MVPFRNCTVLIGLDDKRPRAARRNRTYGFNGYGFTVPYTVPSKVLGVPIKDRIVYGSLDSAIWKITELMLFGYFLHLLDTVLRFYGTVYGPTRYRTVSHKILYGRYRIRLRRAALPTEPFPQLIAILDRLFTTLSGKKDRRLYAADYYKRSPSAVISD
ncbi:hypothetical protein BT96DRAFT_952182, partial [Gymnopus androsaceus JB14]